MNYIVNDFNHEVKTHKDFQDVSFYEDNSKITKVDIECLTPMYGGDASQDILKPTKLEGYFGLYNSSLDKLLNTRPVSSTYQLVAHHELFSEQAKILSQSDLPLDNVTIKDQLYKDGLQAHRTIFFHDLETTVSNNKDKVLSRIDIFNSCDMSWSFQVFSGAYRDLCRNTLVFGGQKAYHQQAKHTRNLSTTALMTKASIGLEFWNNQKDTMLNWRAKDMSLEQFGQILKQTICKKKSKSAELNLTNPVNETKLNYLLDRFEKETPDLGKTMWAGYNALTHWATHTDETIEVLNEKNQMVKIRSGKSTADKPSVQRTRNDEVRTVIECDAWKELEIA